jgi:hypothetical protein
MEAQFITEERRGMRRSRSSTEIELSANPARFSRFSSQVSSQGETPAQTATSIANCQTTIDRAAVLFVAAIRNYSRISILYETLDICQGLDADFFERCLAMLPWLSERFGWLGWSREHVRY